MQLDDFSGWLQHRVNVRAQGVWFDACPIGLNILVESTILYYLLLTSSQTLPLHKMRPKHDRYITNLIAYVLTKQWAQIVLVFTHTVMWRLYILLTEKTISFHYILLTSRRPLPKSAYFLALLVHRWRCGPFSVILPQCTMHVEHIISSL